MEGGEVNATMAPWLDDDDIEELRSLECRVCDGTGDCLRCRGAGVWFLEDEREPITCPDCDGDGECYDCGGSGNR